MINEDRVAGGQGFGTHGHANFEIFSYVVSGGLKHDDSLGNSEVLRRGDVQFTSAGTGIRHSEYNADRSEPVHFLQIWALPDAKGLKPGYQTKTFTDAQKRNALVHVIEPAKRAEGDAAAIKINQDFDMYATVLDAGARVALPLAAGRRAYVHVVDVAGNGAADVGGVRLAGGDGAFVRADKGTTGELIIAGAGSGTGAAAAAPTEVVVFEMA